MAIMTIEEALKKVKERGFFRDIVRYQYRDYDVQECLRLVEQIGKQRTSRFVIDDENRFAYENFIKWLIGDKTMKALHPERNPLRMLGREGKKEVRDLMESDHRGYAKPLHRQSRKAPEGALNQNGSPVPSSSAGAASVFGAPFLLTNSSWSTRHSCL